MHATPADFALGGETLTVCVRYGTSFAKGLGDAHGVWQSIFAPFGRTDCGVDADHAIMPDADLPEPMPNHACLPDLLDEAILFIGCSHGRAAAGLRPHRSNHRANQQVPGGHSIGKPFQVVV